MSADSQHPDPPRGAPHADTRPVVHEEDQDQILAEEMTAFPEEEPLTWEELEYLEYLDDTGPSDEEPCPAGLPGPVPGEYRTTPGATRGATPGTTSAGGSTAAGAGFAHGGAADAMSPGPVLAGLADRVWRDGLDGLDDDELTGILQAAQRLGAWAAALELSAVSGLAARRRSEALASGDWRGFEHAENEIAIALTLTRFGASRVLALALDLDRLPLTRAALAAGRIDERRAAVIADELSGLDDEHAAAVEALIIEKAAVQTTGQLRPAVRRAVIAADPAAVKRRKEEALKDARVEASSQPQGTATLAGRDLPPADVLAADKHLTALAQAMKKAGAEGTMDQLRARAYLHLLAGQPAETLLPPATPDTGTPATPDTGAPGTTGSGAPGTGAASSGTVGTGTAGTGTAGAGAPETRDAGAPDHATPGTRTAGTGAPGLGLPVLCGTVNLTVPLATWLGWSQSPGQVPGFGTVDADDSRAIADLLAGHPATQWCLTFTDPAGRAVAHGCAKHGPPPRRAPGPEPDPRTGPGPGPGPGPGTRAGPGSGPGPGSRAGPGSSPGPACRVGPGPGPRAGSGPGAGPRRRPSDDVGWIATVTIIDLETGTCTHQRESHAYRPPLLLQHLIRIRQATCVFPGCRRPATRCDLDHTIPHHLGGRTCECGLAPLCRAHHQAKQAPGWALTQDRPGDMTWTTPGRRSYTTHPTSYPG